MRAYLGVLLVSMALAGSAAAYAQSPPDSFFRRDRNFGVADKPRPGYERGSIRMRNISLRPVVALDLGYDGNVTAEPGAPLADFVASVEASTDIGTEWPGGFAELSGYVLHNQYVQHPDETTTDGGVETEFGGLITRAVRITAGGIARWAHESRTAIDVEILPVRPIAYRTLGAYWRQVAEYRRMRLGTTFDFVNIDYENGLLRDGTLGSEDRRDHNAFDAALRGDYALGPDTSLFMRTAWKGIRFTSAAAIDDTRSDSDDFRAEFGVDLDITNIVGGELSISYISRYFAEPGLSALHGVGFDARLDWYAARFLTVWADGVRRYTLSGLRSAPSYTETGGSFGMDYEFRPNVIVSGDIGYFDREFTGIDRRDGVLSGGVSFEWLLNRYLTIGLEYASTMQTSPGADPGRPFIKHLLRLRLETGI